MTKLTIIKDFKGDWTLLIQETKHKQTIAAAIIEIDQNKAIELAKTLPSITITQDNS